MYGFGISLYKTNNIIFTEAPVNIIEPSIEGDVISRETVRCDPGEWDYVTSEFSYQWLLDEKKVDGGDKQAYTINVRDIGKKLSCKVYASNVYGITEVETREVLIQE